MSIACARMTAAVAILFAAMLSNAGANHDTPTQPSIIRFPAGAAFEVPQGWSWSKLETMNGNSVELSYDATAPKDKPENNPNRVTVNLVDTPSEGSWTRIDINRSQVLPNGVAVQWKSGVRWNIHSSFLGWATAGSKTIREVVPVYGTEWRLG